MFVHRGRPSRPGIVMTFFFFHFVTYMTSRLHVLTFCSVADFGGKRTMGNALPAAAGIDLNEVVGVLNERVEPTPEVREFLGFREGQRMGLTDITMAVMSYIVDHNLVSPHNPMHFIPDERLGRVLGTREEVSLVQMADLIGRHFGRPGISGQNDEDGDVAMDAQ